MAAAANASPSPSPAVAYDVFVSHSRKDAEAADRVCEALESRGLRCWIAPRDIEPGTPWPDAIIAGIESSRMMLLLWTESSNVSPQVHREIERAVHNQRPILPVRLQEVTPSRTMEYCLGNTQWYDATQPPLSLHLDVLARTAERLVDAAPAGTAREEVRSPAAEARAPSRRAAVAALCLAVLAVAASAALIGGAVSLGEGRKESPRDSEGVAVAGLDPPPVSSTAPEAPPAESVGADLRHSRIYSALEGESQFECVETPWVDVKDFLRDLHQIYVHFDRAGMEEAGVSPEDPVTIPPTTTSIGATLRRVLREQGLVYVVRDESLLITSRDAAETALGSVPAPDWVTNDGDRRVLAALDQATELRANAVTLGHVLQKFAEEAGVEIFVDKFGLEAAGMTLDEPASADFNAISRGAALRLLLRDHGLSYLVRDESVFVSTSEIIEDELLNPFYPTDPRIVTPQ